MLRAATALHAHRGVERCRQAAAAELAVPLERRRPEMRRRCRLWAHLPRSPPTIAAMVWPLDVTSLAEPSPPFTVAVVAPAPAPTLPSAKSRSIAPRRRVAHVTIRREPPPVLVAAVDQVEQDCLRHDRHAHGADRDAATLLAQCGLHAPCGIEAECGTTRQHDGVHCLNGRVRRQQIRVTSTRRTTQHADRRHRWPIEHDHGNARTKQQVLDVANGYAGDIGQQVSLATGSSRM